jgi:predicted O-methyltransferase YrrM
MRNTRVNDPRGQKLKAAASRIKGGVVRRAIRWSQTQPEWAQVAPPPPRPTPVVEQALRLSPAMLHDPTPGPALTAELAWQAPSDLPSSQELFRLGGEMLPCWQESDVGFVDDWLTNPTYYPYYDAFFRQVSKPDGSTRLLEIGVRTGYIAAVFARAARGRSMYVGVDPNVYLRNGLELASATLQRLRSELNTTEFMLIEGFSWDADVQKTLAYSGPFDLIHIDGDHTLLGKLIDLELARRLLAPGGLVLVDDYSYHSPISDAVNRSLALGWYREIAVIPTLRGLAVLR